MSKSILIFSVSKLDDMKKKGNISYIKHYEVYFDDVYMIYLVGKSESFIDGNTHFISLGSYSTMKSLIIAPFKLYKFVKNKKIDVYLTGDLIFSWWNSFLIKILKKAKIFLMPVAMPHVIFETSGKTISGVLPRFIEQFFIKLSFLNAYKVVTGQNIDQYVKWLQEYNLSKCKLLLLDTVVDELPSYKFFNMLNEVSVKREKNILLYVGRLHKEKMVCEILDAFNLLTKKHNNLKLWIIGSGDEEKVLKNNTVNYGLENNVKFLGSKVSGELVEFYKRATLFISPLTGTSLREAALCKLPIVCYEIDWVAESFTNKQELIFAEKNNINDLSQKIESVLFNEELYANIQNSMYNYACKNWNTISVKKSLEDMERIVLENEK